MTSTLGKLRLTQRTRSTHAGAVAVRGVDDEHVDAGRDQQLGALLGAVADADRGADAQLAVRVARGVGEAGLLGDVLDGHQAAQLERVVDDEHALELLAVHQRLALGERRAFAHADQAFARRHDLACTGASRRVSKRRSRLVTMPTTILPCSTGKPEMPRALDELDHLAHRHLGRRR